MVIGHTDSIYLELYDDGRGYLDGHIEQVGLYTSGQRLLEHVDGYHNGRDLTLRFHWGQNNDHCVGRGRTRSGGDLAWHLDMTCSNGFWFVRIGNSFRELWVTSEFDHGENYFPPDSIFNVTPDSVWRHDGSPTRSAFECVPTTNLSKLRRLHIVTYREALESSSTLLGHDETLAILYDPVNQTMVRESVAAERGDDDAFEWEPRLNKRWFAERVIEVKRRHNLSVDPRERASLARMVASGTDDINADCDED